MQYLPQTVVVCPIEMKDLVRRRLIFGGIVFASANAVMYVTLAGLGFFDPRDGMVPYVITSLLTVSIGFLAWWMAGRLVRR
jgi:hypothetical protein